MGLGDFYPLSQEARALAIFMLPFGLVVVGFGVSFFVAWACAAPAELPSDKAAAARAAEAAKCAPPSNHRELTLLERLGDDWDDVLFGPEDDHHHEHDFNLDDDDDDDVEQNATRARAPVVAAAAAAGTNAVSAAKNPPRGGIADSPFLGVRLWRCMWKWCGRPVAAPLGALWNWRSYAEAALERGGVVAGLPTCGRVAALLLRFTFVLALGALFFFYVGDVRDAARRGGDFSDFGGGEAYGEANPRLQRDLSASTLVDCFYLAMVVATTVGYGSRVVPSSTLAQGFCLFYFFYSTMTVGGILGAISNLYIDIEAEKINTEIIDSTIWGKRRGFLRTSKHAVEPTKLSE